VTSCENKISKILERSNTRQEVHEAVSVVSFISITLGYDNEIQLAKRDAHEVTGMVELLVDNMFVEFEGHIVQ
jgi:fumarate hydratase class II